MSFGNWLRSLFTRTRKRDISRLGPASATAAGGADTILETVDLSRGPLKEHHRRRALRDPRLLPKFKSAARQLGLAGRKRVMPMVEAQRLFGGTMRTRRRDLRDLLTDEAQLARYGLPVWKTEADLAAALGLSLKQLWFFGIHRERERQAHYVNFSIPKRSGGRRLIMAPKRRLKAIQRSLLQLLIENLPVDDHSHAFRRLRNIRTAAEPHVGRPFVLKLDLKDFFPTVTAARVRGLLIAYGYSYPVATVLAVLMTEAVRQPVEVEGEIFQVPVSERHCVQGAPTSPGLCNAILLRLDRRLAGFARKHGLAYTRYADDLSFSGDMDRTFAAKARLIIGRIVESEGFKVNPAKTKLMGRGARQTVTGVVVNQTLGLSRQERRRMRAAMHQLRTGRRQDADGKFAAQLQGKVAYLAMLNKGQAEKVAG